MEKEQKPAFASASAKATADKKATASPSEAPEERRRAGKKEDIWNVPNALTFARIIIAFLTIYFIFADFHIIYIVIAFTVAMVTDCLDGQIARRFNMKTEFGRQFDMVADRILMVGVSVAILIKFTILGILTRSHLFQIFLILSREIIASSVTIITIIMGVGVPKARFVGKLTTVMQAITFPMILLSIFYKFFGFSIYFALATGVVGAISAFHYINNIKNLIVGGKSSKSGHVVRRTSRDPGVGRLP